MFNNSPSVTDNYPAHHLPPLILDAVNDVRRLTQASTPLIAASALCALATACQGLADVKRPSLPGVTPISLYFLTLADSGERKTAADGFFFEPIRRLEKTMRQQYTEGSANFELDEKIRLAKVRGLTQRLEKNAKAGRDNTATEEELSQLTRAAPLLPARMRFMLSDITQAALYSELSVNPCTAVLHSNEAADLIKGRTMSNLPVFNRAWDGQTLEMDRKDPADSQWVEGARLSTGLAVQPHALKFLCGKDRNYAREVGYLARTLVAFPKSTAGQRFVDGSDNSDSLPSGILTFQSQVHQLLLKAVERHRNGEARRVLTFEPQAKHRWVTFLNQIEKLLDPQFGRLSPIKDFASKAAEHAARMAAIFEMAQGDAQTISEDSVQRAIAIIVWYLDEFDRLFAKSPEEKNIEKHAEKILVWMRSKSPLTGFGTPRTFTRREIQQFSPRPRDPESVCLVLRYLLTHGHIQLVFGSDKVFQLSNTNNTLSNLESVNFSNEFTKSRGLVSSDTTDFLKRSPI
ncbi:YfjI family protein [Comamonas composti]|uniref:YfjI family protein n=1 Tax=Comamonas composti TaxID=408558 RepID=UPI00042643C0|nr:YfjI family protein [Comamonas composti]